jgi:hypothetical protein
MSSIVRRDFGSFHSSNVEELLNLTEDHFISLPIPFPLYDYGMSQGYVITYTIAITRENALYYFSNIISLQLDIVIFYEDITNPYLTMQYILKISTSCVINSSSILLTYIQKIHR